ncbi:flagellar hook-basal body complex protein [Sinanaerobacter sp. ZZT-01]|uniref:flagellar hook-basal body complex protein n=1 Tax=Sinanaerobacter sp. ZZT-01 TaxID=3111540 RepID=UPI002D76E6E9|nr:flagellar hook-basal body complex protein [Sinanaerobacter sp. ZZT-01]WRR93602.1 flagellar hook-basal body complex protein [Sinanaerobacter sp. ZZT-01]
MVRSMYAAVAGLRAHQTKMDVIGNNIANVNTYGYKKARATFRDQFYATVKGSSAPGETYGGGNPSQIGYGSQIASIDVAHTTGGIAYTDVGTHVMISGNGYYLVGQYNKDGYDVTSKTDGNNPTALNLTRVGIFNFDGNGNLVDGNRNHVYGFKNHAEIGKDPDYLKPDAGGGTPKKTLEALQIPQIVMNKDGSPKLDGDGKYELVKYDADGKAENVGTDEYAASMKLSSISIGQDGTVSGINDKKQVVIIGKIAVANVPNPNALESMGNSYFKAKDNTGIVTAEIPGEGSTGALESGRAEMSNVDLSEEFTDMITAQRGFQANTRIITVTDQMLEELVNLKR